MTNPRTKWSRATRRALVSCVLVCIATSGASVRASANPEVRLEWVSKGGVAIVPPSNTVVVTGADIAAQSELVLRISLLLDAVAIHEFGFEIIFDDDERDELDFPFGNEPVEPTSYSDFDVIGFFDYFESDDQPNGFGVIGPYRGCVPDSVCDLDPESYNGNPVGNRTIVIDEVTFVPTATASNDRRDVTIAELPFNEEFRDANGDLIDHSEIDFGFASVVPEPRPELLAGFALLVIAALARRRNASTAGATARP